MVDLVQHLKKLEGISYGVIRNDVRICIQKVFVIIWWKILSTKTQIGNPEGADVPNKNITIQENGCVSEITFNTIKSKHLQI
jgi:hypothetical protein